MNNDNKNVKFVGVKYAELGAGGYCRCIFCGYRLPHKRGVPCNTIKCPNCNALMVRDTGWAQE